MSVTRYETEDATRKCQRKATDKLLTRLRQQHDYFVPAPAPAIEPPPVEPAPKPAPPASNSEARAALGMIPDGETFLGKVETIQRAVVADFPGITLTDLKSARRTANVVRPRQIAMYLAKSLTLRSLPDIGRRFGGRDHTTVLHAVRKISALVETDPLTAAQIEKIKSSIPVLA